MFDEILNLVKEHLSGNPDVAANVPADQASAVHNEVAAHINNGLQNQAAQQGSAGGLLAQLQQSVASGSPITSAIEGGLVSSLTSKFGLSPAITGAIAGALPGILSKFAGKANDPNDHSITADSINKSAPGAGGPGGLANIFNN